MPTNQAVPELSSSIAREIFASGPARKLLEETILPAYVPRCRWFSGKARNPRQFRVRDMVPLSTAPAGARLAFVEVEYGDSGVETWLLPMQYLSGPTADELATSHPASIIAQGNDGVLCDALHEPAFRADLFSLMAGKKTQHTDGGTLVAEAAPALAAAGDGQRSRVLSVEQSNSSITYGDQVFLKLYRRIEPGLNPDAEILRFLGRKNFPHVPPYAGSVEYRDGDGREHTVALATGLEPNHGDAWSFALRELDRWFAALRGNDAPGAAKIQESFMARATQLGTRTGALHRALSEATDDSNFTPEPFTPVDGKALGEGIIGSARQIEDLLSAKMEALPELSRALATRFLARLSDLQGRIAALANPPAVAKVRCHGDYHLGQVLETGGDFVIIDFEGEPLRSLPSRREKRSPYRDVAGMLRSFDYAAYAALESRASDRAALQVSASEWSARAREVFLQAWLSDTEGAVFRAKSPAEDSILLEAFLLEKALYEVVYELNNRPDWLPIPLRGVLDLLEG